MPGPRLIISAEGRLVPEDDDVVVQEQASCYGTGGVTMGCERADSGGLGRRESKGPETNVARRRVWRA